MKIVMDTHTHTIASGHAYSTLGEMIKKAKSLNLELLGVTEHAPNMPGTCEPIYFQNLNVVPRDYDGMTLMLGIEANIRDYDGNIDVPEKIFCKLDYVIASLHSNCIPYGTIEQNTAAVIGAIKNPHVNIIGHPDNSNYPLDYEAVCKAAKEYNVLLEINNTSLKPGSFRKNAKENDTIMLNLCKKYKTHVSLGSDAHIEYSVADFEYAKKLIEEVSFPEELVVNTSAKKFKDFISLKNNALR